MKAYKGVNDTPIVVMENINGKVLEIIIQYMHFKDYWAYFINLKYIYLFLVQDMKNKHHNLIDRMYQFQSFKFLKN